MNNYQNLRPNMEDTYGILTLQNKIMEIMVYINILCKTYNIDYCLMGGSALGAKRHGGFIPWDDDMDIFMTPDQYDKFRDTFRKYGDKDTFYLQEWGSVDGMITTAKLRMNGTTYIEDIYKDWDMHHGIFVDILILQVCPKHKVQQLHQIFWAKYVMIKGLSVRKYTKKCGIIGAIIKFLGLFPDYFLVKHGLKQVYKYRKDHTGLLCYLTGRAGYKNGIYPSEWMQPTKYADFETKQFRVPNNIEAFLTQRFGNYMEIPSMERMKAMQHAQNWNVECDFRSIMEQREWTFKDEQKLLG